jgi:hypothetical protein
MRYSHTFFIIIAFHPQELISKYHSMMTIGLRCRPSVIVIVIYPRTQGFDKNCIFCRLLMPPKIF